MMNSSTQAQNCSATCGCMGDKEILGDVLRGQKFITTNYNSFAGECQSPQLRNAFLSILTDEHAIQNEIFGEMQSRGWYQTTPAQTQEVAAALNKYQG